MDEVKGFMRRVLLLKFKAETAPDHVERLIKDPISSSSSSFTHVFELMFEDAEGIAAYMVHPAHLEFHERSWPHVEKIVVINYKPTPFHT
ncbi:hypothetical protein EUGRSUZ_K03417 [Eucalyptus grandis]|uniref:Uncharacterized protein n=2 Tax=Eucalyptus grandis TaxID=71139 RepID=A0ACC3IZF2_EUCGR|nr:hypothetical protein EUGRSUZ_K03417 [Eucalyptus grandis]